MPITREWDAASYDRISGPMERMGREVLDRLPLNGDETVIDAGCGSGRITAALLDRLPRGRVIAVDASAAMIAAAQRRLAGRERIAFVTADLVGLRLPGPPADAILSTATLHWIPDHAGLARSLHGLLRPGGRLVAQCGGHGNIEAVHAAAAAAGAREPYAPHFAGWAGAWNFRRPEGMRADLEAAGFAVARCDLTPSPVTPEDPQEWFRTIVLGSHLERLPPDLREPFVAEVVGRMGRPVVVDYVRLNVIASA